MPYVEDVRQFKHMIEDLKQIRYNTYFMDVAMRTALNSYANRAKVGAVLVKDNHILATGWNGRVSGMDNCCEEPIDRTLLSSAANSHDNPELFKTRSDVVHAEANMIYFCAKHGIKTDGTTLYITLSPCATCALAMIQAGITKVYYHEKYRDDTGIKILKESGIEVNEL